MSSALYYREVELNVEPLQAIITMQMLSLYIFIKFVSLCKCRFY